VSTLYHEDENKQAGTIYDTKECRFFPALIRRRDNDFYRRGMAIRYARQMEYEHVHAYCRVIPDRWPACRKGYNRRGIRYKLFPQPDTFIVTSQAGTISLPVDFSTQVYTIDHWIESIPQGKAVGGTRGFGGPWAGSRPKSREPGRYTRLNMPIRDVVEMLTRDGIEYYEDSSGNVRLTVDVDSGMVYVEGLKCPLEG
jgi:hypothetical protein